MADDDEAVDQRFRDLIRAEFGDVAGAREPGAPEPPAVDPTTARRRFRRRALPDPIEYFNLTDAIEDATPDEDFERWNPPGDASLGRPPKRVLIGLGLLLVAMVAGVLALFGIRVNQLVAIVVVLCLGVGLALLFSALPRHRDDPGDGARL